MIEQRLVLRYCGVKGGPRQHAVTGVQLSCPPEETNKIKIFHPTWIPKVLEAQGTIINCDNSANVRCQSRHMSFVPFATIYMTANQSLSSCVGTRHMRFQLRLYIHDSKSILFLLCCDPTHEVSTSSLCPHRLSYVSVFHKVLFRDESHTFCPNRSH